MKVKNVVIDSLATCGKSAIVTDVRIKYKYENGQRTSEQEGYSVACVLPERSYDDLVVSVPAIPSALEQLEGNPLVQFEGLVLTLYGRPDDLRIAAKASAVRIADGKSKV